MLNQSNFGAFSQFHFSNKAETPITFESKIKALLSELGATKDGEAKVNYSVSPSRPLAGVKYSLEGNQLPNLLLLEFYTDEKTDKFVQILENQESISPRLMRNVNYVSADNSIVLPLKAEEDEEKVLLNDIKTSASEFYKSIKKDSEIRR
jgi:hypothetical protein